MVRMKSVGSVTSWTHGDMGRPASSLSVARQACRPVHAPDLVPFEQPRRHVWPGRILMTSLPARGKCSRCGGATLMDIVPDSYSRSFAHGVPGALHAYLLPRRHLLEYDICAAVLSDRDRSLSPLVVLVNVVLRHGDRCRVDGRVALVARPAASTGGRFQLY